jgi:hypothetical protein
MQRESMADVLLNIDAAGMAVVGEAIVVVCPRNNCSNAVAVAMR